MSRLLRFLHIERSRAEGPAAPAGDGTTAGRIEGVERPGDGPGAPAASGADLERFAPPAPPPVELVERSAGARAFTRCMRCGMDHHVMAVECTGCGARLDGDAERAFNERLWAERREEAEREAALQAEHAAARAREDAELAAARRALGEQLAREVGERERRRLDLELGPASGGLGPAGRLLGRLLGKLLG